MSERLVWVAVCVGVVALLVGAALGLRVRRVLASRVSRRRTRHGLAAEHSAEKLLRKRGYQILGRQVRGRYEALVDGQERPVELCADYLVCRQGRELVVEVKTGDAARLGHSDTRRQMLEYQLAFGVSAVLLVDADRGVLHEVCFPLETPRARPAHSLAWLGYAMVAACAGALWWTLRR